ncbi:MAG: hypothetical protein HZA50_00140 [Planctomycetes bacterium]|nr:hypothetical protein [Planctomycetota bacterium]
MGYEDSRRTRIRRFLLLLLVAAAGSFGISGLMSYGRYDPAIGLTLLIAGVLVAILGLLSRRMILGCILGFTAGLFGTFGTILAVAGIAIFGENAEHVLIGLGILFGEYGIVFVIIGSIFGLIGDRRSTKK